MTTPIRISPSALGEGRWYEYVIRFALGGAVTVFTGLVSSRYGASIGGLFLALPVNAEGGRRPRLMLPARHSGPSACWLSPSCSGCW
jgi:hypothetical protein